SLTRVFYGPRLAFNQTCWKPQLLAKSKLFLRHFPRVTFVVVTCQMQNPVQHKDLHLIGWRVSQCMGVPARNIRRNDNVPGTSASERRCRKGQHIGSAILSFETQVQGAHFITTRQQNCDYTAKLYEARGRDYETRN